MKKRNKYKIIFYLIIIAFFYLSFKQEWIIVSNKGKKQYNDVKNMITTAYTKTSDFIDGLIEGGGSKSKELEKKFDKGKKKVKTSIAESKEKEGFFYVVLDKVYQVYNDLFGDPLTYYENKH